MNLIKKHKCDICGISPETIIDGRTHDGRWAWMCKGCFEIYSMYGGKFGTGMAQEFENKEDGRKLRG